jgi:hypothetical protein
MRHAVAEKVWIRSSTLKDLVRCGKGGITPWNVVLPEKLTGP